MIDSNNQATSRARHEPAGVPYTLLYPSTDTEPVTPDNKGMTGRGIPCVAPAHSTSALFRQYCVCLSQRWHACSMHVEGCHASRLNILLPTY